MERPVVPVRRMQDGLENGQCRTCERSRTGASSWSNPACLIDGSAGLDLSEMVNGPIVRLGEQCKAKSTRESAPEKEGFAAVLSMRFVRIRGVSGLVPKAGNADGTKRFASP